MAIKNRQQFYPHKAALVIRALGILGVRLGEFLKDFGVDELIRSQNAETSLFSFA